VMKLISGFCLIVTIVGVIASIEGIIMGLKTYKPFKFN
jgi:hypothetical protein